MPGKPDLKDQSPVPNDWLERLARFQAHFGRFLRDAAGVLIMAFAIMLLLALWGVTSGIILTPLTSLLSVWFGWGGYLILLGIGYGGLVLLRRGEHPVRWGRLLALELALLLTLGLLALAGGRSLTRADAGMDGGRLGWGLAY